MSFSSARRFVLVAAFISPAVLSAGELVKPGGAAPANVAPASNEGELAMKGFTMQKGFKAEMFAAEPDLANPVAFDIDHQNRFWVAETFRLHAGVSDIRGHMDWLDEDLASKSPDERLAMMKRHEGDKILSYEQNSERVKLIWDKDGDGKADGSSVFAEGFSTALDGIGSGVLSHRGKVYFANIPNLWLLEDKDGDGVAEDRKSLSYGYGVRVGFLGHDSHGLIVGPDGRIYFSIGDRGSNIEQDGRRIGHTEAGTVFRCEQDGGNLEVYAFGLRNPQELAFDKYGNLFSGDNNSDGGDRARIVYVVRGGDSGWRVGYQFLDKPNARGVWNSEKMWYPQWEGQAAFLIPPIANLTDGPSGFAYYPGTGMPDKYNEHFFLVDFHGGRSSGIHSFLLKPKGAFFELADTEKFLWNCLPTDVAFGPHPGIYFTDWVQGWGMTGKGRIYHLFEPEAAESKTAQETTRLLMEGMESRNFGALENLLANPDMRVRQEAQFELARRGEKGRKALLKNARKNDNQLARLHAIWGLGQMARAGNAAEKAEFASDLGKLAGDKDAEVRAQVAKVIGDSRLAGAMTQLSNLIADENPRVRVHAAIAAGELQDRNAVPQLIAMLRKANNEDPVQRHAASYALAGIADFASIEKAARDQSPAVRMGALLAMRRLDRAEIAQFLKDSDPRLVVEAARAINDLPIAGAIPELAAMARSSGRNGGPEVWRRVVNANSRYGTKESAAALARLAIDANVPEVARVEALNALANWNNPPGRDPVTGLWRPPVGAREENHAVEALAPGLAELIQKGPEQTRIAAAQAAAKLGIKSSAPSLLASVRSADSGNAAKVAALRALADLNEERLVEAVRSGLEDKSEDVRKEALKFQSKLKPSGALDQIQLALQNGTIGEKQSALGTLAAMQEKAADEIIAKWMDKLLKGEVPKELQLDVIEAASKRDALKPKVQSWEAMVAKGGEMAPYAVALHGGNKAEGRKIFFERAEAACMRCHKIQGENSEGGEVGPELTGLGNRQNREYILESIVFPNKKIAQGFESLMVTTKDGTAFAGVLKSENDKELVLNSPEDGILTIKKENIAGRERGLSSMPEGLAALLSKEDLRNLVEYLSSLK